MDDNIENINKSNAYQLLKKAEEENKAVEFMTASSDFKKTLTTSTSIIHFTVFDDNKFRIETDTKNFLAFFSFNDEKNAKALSNVFDSEFNKQLVVHG